MRSFRMWQTGSLHSHIENSAKSVLADRPDITRPIASAARPQSVAPSELFSQPRVTRIVVETGVPGRVLMAVLARGQIPYGEWVRFVMPLVAMWFVICIGALIVGIWIDWGPS